MKIINAILSKKKYHNDTLTIEQVKEYYSSFVNTEEVPLIISSNPDTFEIIDGYILLKEKYATTSTSDPVKCLKNWDKETMVQCGGNGVVGTNNGAYRTAFFEAFPDNTFIRGEGLTVEDAESAAWEKYEKIKNCSGHLFERRGYTNGAGFCRHCNLFKSKAFEPSTECVVCQVKTNYSQNKDKNWLCLKHFMTQNYSELKDYLQDSTTESDWLNQQIIYKEVFNRYDTANDFPKNLDNYLTQTTMLIKQTIINEVQAKELVDLIITNLDNAEVLNQEFKKWQDNLIT